VHQLTELIHGQLHKGKHHFAVFKADGDFYRKASAELECKPITLQKLLRKFCEAGIVKKLGTFAAHKRGCQPGLYADGYYTEFEKSPVKHPFLTQKNKAALLTLSKKI